MNADKPISATFTAHKGFRVKNGTEYETLQIAYNSAPDNGEVHAMIFGMVTPLSVALNADISKTVTISGGYDASYTLTSGMTDILGRVNIKNGKVIFKQIRVK